MSNDPSPDSIQIQEEHLPYIKVGTVLYVTHLSLFAGLFGGEHKARIISTRKDKRCTDGVMYEIEYDSEDIWTESKFMVSKQQLLTNSFYSISVGISRSWLENARFNEQLEQLLDA